jgi:hypothetical protein
MKDLDKTRILTIDFWEREGNKRERGYLLFGLRSLTWWPSGRATAWAWVSERQRWWSFPWLALALDQLGISMGRLATRSTLYYVPRPPTSLYSAATGAHQTIFWLNAPDHGARGDPVEPLDSTGWEINLTYSPLISTLLLTLYFVLYSFHHRSVHRGCFIITARLPIEWDIHYTLLYFETNSVTSGPLIIQKS